MKKVPDILSLAEWSSLWEPWELRDPNEDDDEFDYSIKCPSCNGECSITLEHSFKDENSQWTTNEYVVPCEYCDGEGKIPIPIDRISTHKLAELYNERVKKDLAMYNKYYTLITNEN